MSANRVSATPQQQTTLDLAQKLFQLIRQLPRSKIWQCARNELTRSEYELLMLLVMHQGDGGRTLAATEISDLLQITPSGVTHLINPLEEGGYLERLRDRADRRVVHIKLTEKGCETAESLLAEFQQRVVTLVEHLGEEDSRTLIRLMSSVVALSNARPEA
jgi:DNA-binding MarR family transcriptional regulator